MEKSENTSLYIYFVGKEEREVVYQYTKNRGFSTFKKYLDNLLFDQEPPEELLMVKRNSRFSHSKKVWSQNKYTYRLTAEQKQAILDLAAENGLSNNLYILSRIKTDMGKHGYNFPDHFFRYIIFYKDVEFEECSFLTDSIEEVEKKIQEEKEQGSQDILLVDALHGSRISY